MGEDAESDGNPQKTVGLEILATLDPMNSRGGDTGLFGKLIQIHSCSDLSNIVAYDSSVIGKLRIIFMCHGYGPQ
jgi:hypothetical protein